MHVETGFQILQLTLFFFWILPFIDLTTFWVAFLSFFIFFLVLKKSQNHILCYESYYYYYYYKTEYLPFCKDDRKWNAASRTCEYMLSSKLSSYRFRCFLCNQNSCSYKAMEVTWGQYFAIGSSLNPFKILWQSCLNFKFLFKSCILSKCRFTAYMPLNIAFKQASVRVRSEGEQNNSTQSYTVFQNSLGLV